jgi:hypothetical protein
MSVSNWTSLYWGNFFISCDLFRSDRRKARIDALCWQPAHHVYGFKRHRGPSPPKRRCRQHGDVPQGS